MPLKLRPGIQHGAEFSSGGRGFRDVNTGRVGNLIVMLGVHIPAVTDINLKLQLEKIHAEINNTSRSNS
jgi:DnaJ-class molecular chaperone